MLSDVDIVKRLGEGISISPFRVGSIKGCSICVTASRFAWSLKTKVTAVFGNEIRIPPGDAAIIISSETISLGKKVAGVCQSKMNLIKLGLGNNAAPIRPGYTGRLLVVINNRTDKEVPIGVNDEIANVLLYNLMSEAESGDNIARELVSVDALDALNIKLDRDEREELDAERNFNAMLVKSEMEDSEQYKELRKRKQTIWDRIIEFSCKNVIQAIFTIFTATVVAILVKCIN
jgi:deoxycytidine triphosphate deaminase